MLQSHPGELAALATAVFWTATALAFESASRKVGSLAVNWIRLAIAALLLSLFCWITRGRLLPLDASLHSWIWLSISGLIGFAVGDLFLFRAFVLIGSRISLLVMSLVPPMTALIGRAVMGEVLTGRGALGMALTVGGVALVVLEKKDNKAKKGGHSRAGYLFALGGALGQSIGLVLSKFGMGAYNAFAATQIRIIAGLAGFSLIFFFLNRWRRVKDALQHKPAMMRVTIGAVFGPFLGVSFSLLAVQHTTAGIASTIMAITPVLIIPPAVLIFHEQVTWRETAGAFIAVAGVALLFL